jgi:hypothetical protein
MFKVELYGRVRRAVLVDGRTQRAVALVFGVSRGSVRKMLRFSVPPGYQRQQPVKRSRLGPWTGVIDAIPGGRPSATGQAAAYGEADPGPASGRTRVTGGYVSAQLTFHYDRRQIVLEQTELSKGLAGKYVDLYDFEDRPLEVRWNRQAASLSGFQQGSACHVYRCCREQASGARPHDRKQKTCFPSSILI